LNNYLKIARPQQWYKNLLVFLALFFSANLLNINLLWTTILGFLSLTLTSIAGYIINDFIDLEKDKLHPEKKHRPLVAGTVDIPLALILSLFCLFFGLSIGVYIGKFFVIFPAALFLLTLSYSLWLKNIVFADILTIASLFALRAVSGAFAIQVYVSPWLLLCPFFLALFLVVGKRHGDLLLLKGKGARTRTTLKHYTLELTSSLITVATTALIICYALYSILGDQQNLWYTLPFALFVIFRYYCLILEGSVIIRHPEKIVADKQMIVGIFLWVIITAVFVYL
jgi:4-hydroxybenzoate polyprenyltransferase